MGSRKQERRKAKQRVREQRRRDREARGAGQNAGGFVGDFGPPPFASPSERIERAAVHAVQAYHLGDRGVDEFEDHLDRLLDDGPGRLATPLQVDRVLFDLLQDATGRCWTDGWQPADLARVVDRRLGARHLRLAVDVIAAELRRYATATLDERWDGQLAALGARVTWATDQEYLGRWGAEEGLSREDTLRHVMALWHLLGILPEIAQLCPPPGKARRGSLRQDEPTRRPPGANGTRPAAGDGARRVADGAESTVDQRMLARVRALLAKAESTEFPEEAEAYTAKAQELMARYSIDQALLAADAGRRDEPAGIRIGIDNPYEAPKSLLLAKVAEANRCSAVWSPNLYCTTVLGFPADLDGVELLYTSLLVQATSAMTRAGSRKDAAGRSRTRSFRQSFLNAYALRIGERLRGATEEATREATEEASRTPGARDNLLPVLASRDEAVQRATEELFPETVAKRVSATDAEGWAHGTAAADRAALHGRSAVTGR